MFPLLVALHGLGPAALAPRFAPLDCVACAAAPARGSDPLAALPRDLRVWDGRRSFVSLVPAGVDDSPFGDKAHGVGGVLVVRLTQR